MVNGVHREVVANGNDGGRYGGRRPVGDDLDSHAESASSTASSMTPQSFDCVIEARRLSPGKPDAVPGPELCGASAARDAVMAAAKVVLVGFWQNAGFTGKTAGILVDSPCDSAGWAIRDSTATNNLVGGITSYTLGNALCTHGDIYFGTDFTGPHEISVGDVRNVGVEWNDHVLSFRGWRA